MEPNWDSLYAVKTWRYVRLAMVLMVAAIAAAVLYERAQVHPGCFQRSISAYWYTPARGVFVGALVAIGVCLVCLRGNTPIEDLLLNVAGMLAPIVALVPTPDRGSCSSVFDLTRDQGPNVANNVTALIVVGALGLVIAGVLLARAGPVLHVRIAYAAAVVIWAVTATVFLVARPFFTRTAHYAAAVLLFGCIVLVACSNARGYQRVTGAGSPRNRYAAIAAAMALSVIVFGLAGLLGWDYWLIALETALISLFAVFWVIQTVELWNEGLRTLPAA